MVIDNRLLTGQLKMAFIILFTTIVILTCYAAFEGQSFWEHYYILGLVVALVLVFIYLLTRRMYYFYFNDEKTSLIIRYYAAFPLFRKYKAVEIPFKEIDNYEIVKSVMGLQEDLIIHRKTVKGIFKYPKISISALTEKEKEDLRQSFKQMFIYYRKNK